LTRINDMPTWFRYTNVCLQQNTVVEINGPVKEYIYWPNTSPPE